MPIQGIEQLALSEIPDLELGIVRGRDQVVAGGVEGDGVYRGGVGVVVLQEALGTDIEDLDFSVVGGRGEVGAVGVEFD